MKERGISIGGALVPLVFKDIKIETRRPVASYGREGF